MSAASFPAEMMTEAQKEWPKFGVLTGAELEVAALQRSNYLAESQYLPAMIRKCGFRFVIVDPLRLYEPTAESDNPTAIATIQSLRKIVAETQASILFVHHPKKPNQEARSPLSLDIDPHRW